MTSVKLRDRVLYVNSSAELRENVHRFVSGEVDEVYFDASDKSIAAVRDGACEMRILLNQIKSLIDPIVVGQHFRLDKKTTEAFTEQMIRTTGLSFDQYCEMLKGHQVPEAGLGR